MGCRGSSGRREPGAARVPQVTGAYGRVIGSRWRHKSTRKITTGVLVCDRERRKRDNLREREGETDRQAGRQTERNSSIYTASETMLQKGAATTHVQVVSCHGKHVQFSSVIAAVSIFNPKRSVDSTMMVPHRGSDRGRDKHLVFSTEFRLFISQPNGAVDANEKKKHTHTQKT